LSLTRNITGLSWYIDNHVVDAEEGENLRRLYLEGWIDLQTPDTVMVEQSEANDKATKERLLEQRSAFPMSLGPIILDHSFIGYSVLGSDEDEARIDKVHQTLWPTRSLISDRQNVENNRRARTYFRDTLIVATSIGYGGVALVTNDKGILKARDRLRKEFNGFDVMSISRATDIAFDEVQSWRRDAELEPNDSDYQNLPIWPPESL
jgi:hypothetical protein